MIELLRSRGLVQVIYPPPPHPLTPAPFMHPLNLQPTPVLSGYGIEGPIVTATPSCSSTSEHRATCWWEAGGKPITVASKLAAHVRHRVMDGNAEALGGSEEEATRREQGQLWVLVPSNAGTGSHNGQ